MIICEIQGGFHIQIKIKDFAGIAGNDQIFNRFC